MTAILLRLVIIGAIGLLIYFGLRRIWLDWSNKFKNDEEQARLARRERDLAERQRPDVIDLKQDQDGTYRPKDDRTDRG
ncbi:hypothetical protein O9Z70_03015 [Devosia sp. YIM 151766]|uniref:hypothetical protein n=1 Tax=Devosia sp. YIM 151766 TaxID=3017325 RepID=UPI00255D0794|nr:hypothetical protein [Devosia sp. YIM 151766]WIY53527.1 hypothetical protein O9Z70_03015 [Devosia sp. YIM 151766]